MSRITYIITTYPKLTFTTIYLWLSKIEHVVRKHAFTIFAALTLVLILYQAKLYSYILFHTFAEIFSIIIAGGVFVFAWNTRKISRNNYFLFLGLAFLSVGIINIFHTLAYKGMPVFLGFTADTPTQLWIAQRYFLAISFLVAPFFLVRKLKEKPTLIIFAVITTLVLLSIFYWQNFPASFIEGSGLTPFKKVSEYIISLIFFGAIIFLRQFRNMFDKTVWIYLSSSLILNIIAELLFTLYVGVYDIFNMLGHIGTMFSYYLIYKAIVEVGLTKPYNLLFLELKQMDERKDDFLRTASHELKTPITTIYGYSQILYKQLAKSNNSKNTYYITQINTQINKLNNLINDLLDVSKIESKKMTFKMIEFDLKQLLQQVVSDLQHLSENHQLIIKENTKASIRADKDKIEQVLTNIFTNAIKYSPNGGKIIINLKKDSKSVTLSVQDFGIGINKEILPLIFDKYYRTPKGEQNAQGLGLGLFITKEIIKSHKGKIWMESEPGQGSIVSFSLPINK